MRWLALVLMLPLVQAAVFEDPAGDQRLGYATHYENGEAQYRWLDAEENGWYQNVDIRSVEISETDDELVFTMHIGSMDADAPPGDPFVPRFDAFAHVIRFTLGGEEYHVGFVDDPFQDRGVILAQLSKFESPILGTLYFPRFFDAAAARELTGSAGWTGQLPKEIFRTTDLIPLREGHVLEGITLRAANNDISFGSTTLVCPDLQTQPPGAPGPFGRRFCRWTVEDPGEGAVGAFEVQSTPPGVGHLFLRMEAPYRLSNGLATTYLFEASLHNLEPIDDQVLLQVSDVPAGWEVRLPSTATFTGEARQTIPIAVTIPFSHQHGKSHIMTLSALSSTDDVVMEVPFGVIFADPPQPAGHHDTLWFHGEDPCGADFNQGAGCPFAYMNAGREPQGIFFNSRPADEARGDEVYRDALDPDQADLPAQYQWVVNLVPSLGIGLDFDTSEQGTLELGLRFSNDVDARIDAQLVLVDFLSDDWQVLATGTTQHGYTAGTAAIIELPLDVLPVADEIPFQPGRTLLLWINATDEGGLPWQAQTSDATLLLDDSSMQLPLLDYHEAVDLSGLEFSDLQMTRLNQTFKQVNPGNTTLFGFRVDNIGEAKATIDWALSGANAEWASLQPLVTHVGAGNNGTIVVRVKAPATAVEGDAAELLLTGTSREDPDVRLFGRLTAYVVEERAIPDESLAAEDLEEEAAEQNARNKESPLPFVLLVGALLLARRR